MKALDRGVQVIGQGLLIIVTFGFFLYGMFIFLSTSFLVVRAEQTQGKVVDYETEYHTSKGKTSSATFLAVAFKSKDGQYIKFKSNTTTNNTSHQMGSEVPVIYVPSSPNDARINEFGDIWALPLFGLVFGSAMGAVGLLCVRKLLQSDGYSRRKAITNGRARRRLERNSRRLL
jgi:hypothetical protein